MKSVIYTLSFLLVSAQLALGAGKTEVFVEWEYKNFDFPIEAYEVTALKSPYVSETKVVASWSEVPKQKAITQPISVPLQNSYSFLITVENKSDKDIYFFAVPHELNPAHASAGHYFECLCINRLFKIPSKKIWYRIVRINLNEDFNKMKSFRIKHQIMGVSEADAKTKYKEKLYE